VCAFRTLVLLSYTQNGRSVKSRLLTPANRAYTVRSVTTSSQHEQGAGTGLTTVLASFVCELAWEGLPGHVQDSARGRLLDALSTSVASRDIAVTRVALGTLQTVSGPCTVLPTGGTSSVQDAAFVNGVATHALLFEDINLPSADHPGAVVVPSALAAAEAAVTVIGRVPRLADLLTAIVAGYETQLYLGEIAAQGIMHRGLRTTSILGCVAASAAVSRLFSLSVEQTAAALSLGANLSCGLLEAWSHGTPEPYLQAGFAARNGILAGLIARSGVETAPTTLEGDNGFFRAFADLDTASFPEPRSRWRIGGVLCKPYPISGAKLTSVDSALAIRRNGVDPRQIRKILVRVPPLTKEFPGGDRKGPFNSLTQAQDSTPFCVSAALLGRPMNSVKTFTEGFNDPEISDLSQLVEVLGEDGREIARIEVTLADGQFAFAEVDERDGHRPSVQKMADKLRALADSWAPGATDAVIELVRQADETSVAELSRLIQR
jgi:2-methylcitrate dehydratase PrpD